MERLTGEARDRVRATSLWLVTALTLVIVILGLWATFIGFEQVTPVSSDVVTVSADEREITVELVHGSCQYPAGVDVEEGDDVVVLTAQLTERIPLRGRDCSADAVVSRSTATLDEPLGDRELRDGAS